MPDSGTPPPLPTTGATIAASTPTEASPESPTASAQSPATSPEGVVQAFYNWYLGYKGNPLATRAYRTSPYLTPDFVQRIDNALISLKPGIPADPFICAQNPPTSITAGTASISGDRATVVVQAHYSGSSAPNNLPVSLVRVNGQWKIDDVKCPTNPGQLSPVGTP
jgi:hypothetical protein